MQVSSSYLPALPIATDYRRDDSQRAQRIAPAAERSEPSQQGEITRIRTRAAARTESVDQASPFAENVANRNRTALQTYQSNGPSIQERLGVELAGIDVYA